MSNGILTLREHSRQYVLFVLAGSGGNKRKAAKALDISYNTLQKYLREEIVPQPGAMEELKASVRALGEAPSPEPEADTEPVEGHAV